MSASLAFAQFSLLALVALSAYTDEFQEFQDFQAYKKQFNKIYIDEAEDISRFKAFRNSLKRITALNDLNGLPAFGLTDVSDMDPKKVFKKGYDAEMEKTGGLFPAPVVALPDTALPMAIDWRLTPAVTPVKNQGQCGGCWAFSAISTVESQYILHVSNGSSQDFSPQQVLSCAALAVVNGCGGGVVTAAYEYLKGVPLFSSWDWPWVQSVLPQTQCNDRFCTAKCYTQEKQSDLIAVAGTPFVGTPAQVYGFVYATAPCLGACRSQNLRHLAKAVAFEGPVSVCVNADVFGDYVGGIITAAACGNMDSSSLSHCLQLVGFNTTAPTPYWIVRNQWTSAWGIAGYAYLEYGENTCGIANMATIPIVNPPNASTETHKAHFARLQARAQGPSSESTHYLKLYSSSGVLSWPSASFIGGGAFVAFFLAGLALVAGISLRRTSASVTEDEHVLLPQVQA